MDGEGTPFGHKFQLYCERGFLLTISKNGEISGTQDEVDPYTYLKAVSGHEVGHVKIQGLQSELYICFGENGVLCGKTDPQLTGTTFKEHFCYPYNCYESMEYEGWYIGIDKHGIAKNGYKTQPRKKSTKFLPRRID